MQAKIINEGVPHRTMVNYSYSFFKGWKPTLLLLAGGTAHWFFNDREFHTKIMLNMKDTYNSTPDMVKYSAILLGFC